jgi:hypothetical protein
MGKIACWGGCYGRPGKGVSQRTRVQVNLHAMNLSTLTASHPKFDFLVALPSSWLQLYATNTSLSFFVALSSVLAHGISKADGAKRRTNHYGLT